MTVTSIEQQKKNKEKYSVFIDGNYAFSLIMQDILYFKIKEGEEIPLEKYNYIMDNLVYIKAQDTAINFLSYRMRTKKEIENKLREKDYSFEIIEKVTNFLEKYNYINDYQFAVSYVRECQKLKPKSKRMIKYELALKGIKEDIVEEAFLETDINDFENALKILNKKFKFIDKEDLKQKNKIYNYLSSKGFGWDSIKEAYEEAAEKRGED